MQPLFGRVNLILSTWSTCFIYVCLQYTHCREHEAFSVKLIDVLNIVFIEKNHEEESISVILQVAVKFTLKVHISRHIAEHIQVKNPINVHGKDVHGVLLDQMNLPDIFVNILEQNHLNVSTVNELLVDLIT